MVNQQFSMLEKEETPINWDFKEANTKEYTHGFHTYPAMMIPQIARKLIDLYGRDAKVLLDPFCGSGTSLVEASLTDHIQEAHGLDLNPLAVLVSKVKTTPLNQRTLELTYRKLLENQGVAKKEDFKNIEFWFKPNVIENLGIIKSAIEKINDQDIRDFFFVAFSETVRNVSNTRKREFKLYRKDEKMMEKHNPDVFMGFGDLLKKNIKSMAEYQKSRKATKTITTLADTRERIPLPDRSVNIVVTSPPYGDSRTTVAYGQFSRLSLQWFGQKDVANLDNRLLGGVTSKDLEITIKSPTLQNIINKISHIDSKRAKEVLSFYKDFDKCVIEIDRVMAKNGFVCFVVGNRTVKGINIPTDKIMTEMFKARGNYEYITTHERTIPMKRMPKANSPSNKVGEKVTTMNNEYIFVLKKK